MSRDVYNRAGEKLGAINDFLVGPDGRIIAAIIVVGGFLGICAKEVALPFSSVQATCRDNDWQIVIDKAAPKDAPTFEVGRTSAPKTFPKAVSKPSLRPCLHANRDVQADVGSGFCPAGRCECQAFAKGS